MIDGDIGTPKKNARDRTNGHCFRSIGTKAAEGSESNRRGLG
jgi:hypothetical protein